MASSSSPSSMMAPPQQHSPKHTRTTTTSGNNNNNVAADAEFLESMPSVLELHKSNLLRMETQELLQECRLDLLHCKWHTAVHQYISNLNGLLRDIHATTIVDIESLSASCPLPLHADKPPVELELKEPLQIVCNLNPQAVGITTRAGNANQIPTLRGNISLPLSLFATKDYLNNRYFHKRNLILWHLVQQLSKCDSTIVGKVQWKYASGNQQQPCIALTPPLLEDETKTNKKRRRHDQNQRQSQESSLNLKRVKFQLNIFVGMASIEWLPSTRLFPDRSNLKGSGGREATSIYNYDLVHDSLHFQQEHEEEDLWPRSLLDALILLKVWCLQRGFLGGHDSFADVHQVGHLLWYLFHTKHVTSRMAPLQIITVWFKFVAEHVWLQDNDNDNDNKSTTKRKALVMPLNGYTTEAQTIHSCPQAQLYKQHANETPLSESRQDPPTLVDCFLSMVEGPVLLNSKMTCNLWARLSPSFMRHVQHAARMSLDCLHSTNNAERPFSALFMESARFYDTMDAAMRIPLSTFLFPLQHETAYAFDTLARKVYRILYRALGDRVSCIRILTSGNGRIDSSTTNDPSRIPIHNAIASSSTQPPRSNAIKSPLGDDELVIGFTLNRETCHRVVDRGPPTENVEAVQAFLDLWGKGKAQLRRFKDGAIVHAVVWNTPPLSHEIRMEEQDKTQGGIVERIVCHVLNLHFFQHKKNQAINLQFRLCDMLSLVDGVASPSSAIITTMTPDKKKLLTDSKAAHRNIMSAFDSLSELLRQHSSPNIPVPGSADTKTSKLGVPLPIDAVEPLSPCLRYSELFPPLPHPSLGGGSRVGKVSGIAPSPPILIQLRFGLSSKWPTDLTAMAAAKTAMLIQLANGIEEMRASGFEGPIQVTTRHMDIGFKGYSWRIVVRADPELHMLRKLQKPTPEAVSLLHALRREHVVSAMHHSMIHAIHTAHPSAGSVVRLAKRWIACHLLSDLIPMEAIELLVAKVYTSRDVPLDPPATVVSGFIRFLHLLASHDWTRRPLVVDPHGHIGEDDHSNISLQFERARGPEFSNGPPMYIVSPNDRRGSDDEDNEEPTAGAKAPGTKGNSLTAMMSTWTPTFTQDTPERVVLARAAALAKRSYDFLYDALSGDKDVDWSVVFQETPSSFMSYSALLRVGSDFIVDRECSSTSSDMTVKAHDGMLETSYTRSMRQRSLGPEALRRKVYRNLSNANDDVLLHGWRPVEELVQTLRDKFGSLALYFYNDLTPEVIGMLWRPTTFQPQPLSIMHSECVRPVQDEIASDSLVIHNQNDIIREIRQCTDIIVDNIKVLDDKSIKTRLNPKKRRVSKSSSDEESTSDSD